MGGVATVTKYVNWNEVPLILGTQEAADVLDVHVNTIKNLIQKGDLKAFKVGRVLKIHKSELMRFVGLNPQDDSN